MAVLLKPPKIPENWWSSQSRCSTGV